MSHENVEIVRRCYGFWIDRDLSPFPELFHPDVVIDLSRNVFNPATYRGLEGFRRVLEQVDEMWDTFQIEPEEFIDAGDNVFVASRMSGRGRGSGVEAEMRAFAIWTLREGKVSQVAAGYRNRAEALEAAGLREKAMSGENVEIVRSNFEAANRRDWDTLFRNSHPDVELTTPPRGPNAGTYRGREEIQGFWEDLASAFEATSGELERLVESGDQVVGVVRSHLQPKGSSGEIELRTGFLWTFRDGKVASLRLFAKPEEALEVAGLLE